MNEAQADAVTSIGSGSFGNIAFAESKIITDRRSDGTVYLRSGTPLQRYDPSLAVLFRAAVEAHPDRLFLAEREGQTWRRLTYAMARRAIDAIAEALLERGCTPERPIMILSANSIDHGLLMLASYTAGIPVAPISVAYSLQSEDHAKLKHIAALLDPSLIYVADTGPFGKALAAVAFTGAAIVASRNGANLRKVIIFDDLARTTEGQALEKATAAICADTVAKILFTSGSTGHPKGVMNTHGMLSANQQQLIQVWPFVAEQPLTLVDWLPWSHTFGGNHNFNLILRHAGTLFIDAGKPLPNLVEQSVQNLREVSPTIYFNVPAGYATLLPHLERDEPLAHAFFRNLRLIFYAGAALPQDIWERLAAVSVRLTGRRVPMTSSWGATETAPLVTSAHFFIERAGNIGVPVPGTELKLVPIADKFEAMVRGPNVTPGYWKRADLTEAAFDEEGFYRPGDAVRFADPDDPGKGLIFDGRISEDFKLGTGTWVNVGELRVGAIAAATPVIQDVIVAGENRNFIGILAWLNAKGCQAILGHDAPLKHAGLARHAAVREHVRAAIARWNAARSGTSQHIARVILLPDLPSIDSNEITDKGYINQRLALERRATEVDRLFAAEPDADLIIISPAKR
jgi:feruloyl-CoA synthase